MHKPCVCGLHKPFAKCCGRFLTEGQLAKTPEQLMRSRYSAYALGGYGDYLLATWFSATAGELTAAALSEKSVEWQGLEVLSSEQHGDKAMVEFKAHYLEIDSLEIDSREIDSRESGCQEADNSQLQTLHEISVFQRSTGRWLYVGGEVSSNLNR